MKVFRLDSDDLFVTDHPTFADILRVLKVELQEPVISLHYGDNTNYIADLQEDNDALEVFDHTISGPMMISLKWLSENRILLINRQGNIYWKGNDDEHNSFFRLNDMFNWSIYGVHLSNIANNVWNRLYLETNEVVVTSKDKLLEEYEQKNKDREKELIECKQKLQEVESKLSASQKDLEEKEKTFTGLEVRYVEMEKQFEATKKQLWQTENKVEEKEKVLANLQICFAEKEAKFKLMEKHLSYIEKTLEEKSEDLRKTKKHLARTEKILEENNEDLRKTKLELEAKGRVIEVWTTLWERQLGISRLPPTNQGEEDFTDQTQVRVTFEQEGSRREEGGITRSDP